MHERTITANACSKSDLRYVSLVKNYKYPDDDGNPEEFAFEGDSAAQQYECVGCGTEFESKTSMVHHMQRAWREALAHVANVDKETEG